MKPSKAADIFHSGVAFCTSRRNLSLTLTLLLLRLCAKRKQPFVLSFSRENSVFHTNQLTLSINPFCCEEYSKIVRRKIAQKKFHASACVIFNVTVDSAGGQALRSRDSSVLTTSKALDRAVFQGHREFSPQTCELIIIIIIIIIITNWRQIYYVLPLKEKGNRNHFYL